MARALQQVSATGDVTTVVPAYLHSVSFTAAGTTPSVEVRDGATGAVRLTLQAAVGETVIWTSGDPAGVLFVSSIHATVAGAGALASFEYS